MKMHHTPWHWIVLAAVLAIALFTLNNAYGQSTGSAAVFEGRPAMAGAQAGQGAMAGPAQGGITPQSPGDARGGIVLQRPATVDAAGPSIPRDPGMERPSGRDDAQVRPQRDRDPGNVIKRDRDSGGASEQGKATNKAKRAGKRSVERARRGVSGVDS